MSTHDCCYHLGVITHDCCYHLGVITHRTPVESVAFSDDGITIRRLFARHDNVVSWDEVDFVSVTPTVERVDGRWVFKDLGLEPGWDILRDRGLFVLEIALRDRHAHRRLRCRPLWGADDSPDPHRGYFSLDLSVRRLDAAPEALLALVAQHSRFELICHFD